MITLITKKEGEEKQVITFPGIKDVNAYISHEMLLPEEFKIYRLPPEKVLKRHLTSTRFIQKRKENEKNN